MSDETDALPAGTLFGSYRVERLLGAGAMGAVYRATHTRLHKLVVLKVLHPGLSRSPAVRARFEREGRAAAAIRHPHVVDVTDVGEHEGLAYLVLEHLEGETLEDLLAREGALAPPRAIDLMLPVIAAVDAAHAAGVVHRDLKPANLFIARTPAGEAHPKVLDFGISRVVSEETRQTATAALLGTPAYMAPEQIESTRDADARSDQYALSVVLYECLTGRRAFDGETVYAILKRVGDGAFAPPRAVCPGLSPALEAIVLRAMSRDPRERFASLRDFSAALLPFASERTRLSRSPALHAPVAPVATAVPPPPESPAKRADTLSDSTHERAARALAPGRGRARSFLRVVAAAVLVVLTVLIVRATREAPSSTTAAPTPRVASPPMLTAPPVETAPLQTPSPVPAPPVATTAPPPRVERSPPRRHGAPPHRPALPRANVVPDLPP
jgi:serine/threonine-protein kinase